MGLAVFGRSGKTGCTMRVTTPVPITLPATGVRFAESVHAAGFRMAERTDPFHKVLYVLAGRAELRRPGARPLVAAAGSTLLVPADTAHALADLEPATILLLCFSADWLDAAPGLSALWSATARGNGPLLRLPGAVRLRVEALWRRALFEQARTAAGHDALVQASALDIVVQLGRAESLAADQPVAARIRALAKEIEGSFVEPWTIDGAAARAAMSRRSFTTYFRAEMGTTFWDYLEQLRVDHAAQLLAAGEHTVIGVMFSSGFNDLSTFYRAYRRRKGQSPKQGAGRK